MGRQAGRVRRGERQRQNENERAKNIVAALLTRFCAAGSRGQRFGELSKDATIKMALVLASAGQSLFRNAVCVALQPAYCRAGLLT
jgi:hypothetical protein